MTTQSASKRYSSTLSLTSEPDWGEWTTPRPGRFTLGKEIPYPVYRRLGGSRGRSGRVRKISPPAGLRSPDRPARSESPYQLSYPGRSIIIIKALLNIITLVIAIKKWIRSRAFLCDICVLYYWHCHWQHDSTIAVLDTCTAISYLTILVHCFRREYLPPGFCDGFEWFLLEVQNQPSVYVWEIFLQGLDTAVLH